MHLVWWAPLLMVGFVVGAILLNVGVWWGLLRLFEAIGARRSANLFLAVRQLAGPKSGFLSVIGLLSILGVSFSSCALDTVLSVMGGFQEDLKRKIVGSNAHAVIDRERGEGIVDYEAVLAKVRAVPEVVGATPLVVGEALVQSPRTQNLAGVIVRGVDVASVASATDLGETLQDGATVERLEHPFAEPPSAKAAAARPPPVDGGSDAGTADGTAGADGSAGTGDSRAPPRPGFIRTRNAGPPARGIFIGAQLADSMNVEVGDELQLIAPMGDLGPTGPVPKTRPFLVAGVFQSGMYEYDSKYVYIPLREAQRFFGVEDVASQIAVRVSDLDKAPAAVAAIRRVLPPELRVLDWQSINKNLFAALKLEKVMMFIMLSLSILVASFSIISTLTLMVFEKHREIALLKALGATDGSVRRVFQIQGFLIGLAGAITGSVLGLCLCLIAKYVVPFPVPKEVFYINRLPVSLALWDFLLVGLSGIAVSVLSTAYPSRIASRLRPADGLREE